MSSRNKRKAQSFIWEYWNNGLKEYSNLLFDKNN